MGAMHSTGQLLIAGGGIAGMAAALAAARAGWEVRVYERTAAFAEIGAGLQLGPNVTRILRAWGLEDELRRIASFPERLVVRNATSGAELGILPMGRHAVQRYDAPYATVHRGEFHALLLAAATGGHAVHVNLGQVVEHFRDAGTAVRIGTSTGTEVEGDALLGADGLLSGVRQQLLGDGPPRPVGDIAYRGLLLRDRLPTAARANEVTLWLGANLHVVHYPVKGGAALNVVAVVRGGAPANGNGWDHHATSAELTRAMAVACAPLRDLVAAAPAATLNQQPWRRWVLSARAPVAGATEMARGLVALAGDAAHPMRPYMAQGAGMAIEDAAELGRALAMDAVDLPTRLQRYALARWQRCARVQARSARNGEIFHARGLMRLGRDTSIRLLGERVLDVPWLYAGP